MAADNQTRIVITARDETSAAFASAKAGLEKFSAAYSSLGALAGAGVGAALVASVRSTIDLGDQMNDLSQRVGISVKDLATWTLAANQSGTSIEAVAKGVKGLSKFMVENGAALAKAGVDAKDANGALIQLADLFAAMPDGVEKTALAVKLFGKAGMDMIPMLNLGSKGLQEAQDKAKAYGERMALLAPLADKFNDQLAEMALQSKLFGLEMVTRALPTMIRFAEELKVGKEIAGGWVSAMWEFGVLLAPDALPKSLNDTRTALEKLHAEMAKGKEQNLADGGQTDLSGIESRIGIMERRKKYLQALERNAVMANASKLGDYRDARDLSLAPSTQDALKAARELLGKEGIDKEGTYLAGLRNQLNAASGDTSEYSKQLLATSEGAAKDFSQATKNAALALAKKIDTLKAATKANEDHARVLEKVARIEDAANKTVSDFGFKQGQNVEGINTRTASLGMTPFEARQAEAARAIEKDYEDAVKRINEELGKIGDIEGISEKTYALTRERDRAREATAAALDAEKAKQDALNASWEYGANTALRKYREELANIASTVEGAVTRAFKGMEDSLVQFVKTGKLDFKSLADSIITDLIRIQVRESITGPLAKMLKGAGGLTLAMRGGDPTAEWNFGVDQAPGIRPSFAGGGYTGSGSRSGGLDGKGGFLAMLHPQETVIDHTAGRSGGGGVTIVQSLSFDVGVAQTVRAEVMNLMPQIQAASQAAVLDARLRGGSARMAFKG